MTDRPSADPSASFHLEVGNDSFKVSMLRFTYRNWRGEVGRRLVLPIGIEFGSTDWHHEPQWLLRAMDVDKQLAVRLFAMKDMSDVTDA